LATFNVADLNPYLEDDLLVNLRANFLEQGEDDGGPSMEHDLGPQNSQGSPSTSTKIQGLIQPLVSQRSDLPGFDSMHKPGLVHLIS